MPVDIKDFLAQVRLNCAISDSQYWGYYSICGLLLRMRELYLCDKGLLPWQPPPQQEVAEWISTQEARWQELEASPLHDIRINSRIFSPFDTDSVNAHLQGTGLLYGAGFGTFNKPVFFLGRLVSDEEVLDYRVRVVESELCRDLSIHPAMLQGRCIFIRRDAVRSVLWDRLQAISSRTCKGTASTVFESYGLLASDAGSHDFLFGLDRMIKDASGIFLWHEIGEAYEDDRAEDWLQMLVALEDKYAELYLRGIKDVLADTSLRGTLRLILNNQDRTLLALYASLLDGIRKDLFTEAARPDFIESDWAAIEAARAASYGRMDSHRLRLLNVWKESGSGKAVSAELRQLYPPDRRTR